MKFSPAREVPQLLAIGAMFVVAIASWPSARARIPVHWVATGQPDRYGGKVEGLLVTPLIAAVAWIFLYLVQNLFDTKPRLASAFVLLRFGYLASLVLGYTVILLTIRGITVPLGPVVISILALNACTFANFIWRAVSASRLATARS